VSTEKAPSDRSNRTAVSKFINSVSRSEACASGSACNYFATFVVAREGWLLAHQLYCS
jgi:hypothetical protein